MFFSSKPPFFVLFDLLNHVQLLLIKKLDLNKNDVKGSTSFLPLLSEGLTYLFFVCLFSPDIFNKSKEAIRQGNIKGIWAHQKVFILD